MLGADNAEPANVEQERLHHIESQLTDLRRMDIIVDFGLEQCA